MNPCLNCNCETAQAYCPNCGQRHVAAEDYDVKGLAIDYSVAVVSKMKSIRTLFVLFRHPGELTVRFMNGHRIDQVNPVWLFLFVWTSVIAFATLFLQAESATFLEDIIKQIPIAKDPEIAEWQRAWNAKYLESSRRLAPYFMGIVAYAGPAISLVVCLVLVRLFATRRWIEAWVFSLQIGVVDMLLLAPNAVLMAALGLWGQWMWLVSAVGYALRLVFYTYLWFAFRRAFAERLTRPIFTSIAWLVTMFVMNFIVDIVFSWVVILLLFLFFFYV